MSVVVDEPPDVTVISIGNALAGDDGIAHDVVAALARRRGSDRRVRFVQLDGEPCRLIEAWRGLRVVWVIDAMVSGLDPGAVVEVAADEVATATPRTSGGGSHAAGLADAIALGRAIDVLPPRLRLFGIEATVLRPGGQQGVRSSEQLAAAIDELDHRLHAELTSASIATCSPP